MIAHVPLRRAERWAYFCLSISLAVWALLDVVIALWFGVAGELWFVAIAFILAAMPLFLGRNLFGK